MTEATTPVYACDFDGKVCQYLFPKCGPPIERTVALLRRLKTEGWRIIIHTCRVNAEWPERERLAKVQEMLEWLLRHKVPFDQVWGLVLYRGHGTPGMVIPPMPVGQDPIPRTSPIGALGWWYDDRGSGGLGKPLAHVYDDDRGLGDDDLDGRTVDDLVARCWLLYHRAEREHADAARVAGNDEAGS